jgi:hypothetical protein
MLLPPTTRSSRSSRSTRFGRERRHIRKLAVVCRILGLLCALVAVGFFISSFFVSGGMKRDKVVQAQRQVSLYFLGATPALLILGVGLDWWKHRFYGRGQKRRSSSSDSNGGNGGNGQGGSPESQRAEKLPVQ